jgi:hypothetical protein
MGGSALWNYVVKGWGVFVIVATAMGLLQLFYAWLREAYPAARAWGLAIWGLFALSALIVIGTAAFIRANKEIARVRFEPDASLVAAEATKMLKAAKKSLYYYGGIGLISDCAEWSTVYRKKAQEETFRIVRLMDLKTPSEMGTLLAKIRAKDAEAGKWYRAEMVKYNDWIESHEAFFEDRSRNSIFESFDGAPIWKYATHYLIFDRRHVVVIFLNEAGGKNALFIRDHRQVASAMVESIEHLRDLGLTRKIDLESFREDYLKDQRAES